MPPGPAQQQPVAQPIPGVKNLLAVASGKRTKSELLGYGDEEFQPWLQSATL